MKDSDLTDNCNSKGIEIEIIKMSAIMDSDDRNPIPIGGKVV